MNSATLREKIIAEEIIAELKIANQWSKKP